MRASPHEGILLSQLGQAVISYPAVCAHQAPPHRNSLAHQQAWMHSWDAPVKRWSFKSLETLPLAFYKYELSNFLFLVIALCRKLC